MSKLINKYSKNEDIEILKYGQELLFFNSFLIISMLFFGFVLNELIFTVFWIFLFSSLRINLGGYHCKTKLKCYIFTHAVYFVSLFIYIQFNYYKYIIGLLIYIIIGMFLNDIIINKYDLKLVVIIFSELIIGAIFSYCLLIVVSAVMVNIMSYYIVK